MSWRRRLSAVVLGLAVALSAAPVLACDCQRYPSAAAHLADAEVVFVGRAVATVGAARMGVDTATTFQVSETLKGRAAGRVVVRHPPDVCCICGARFVAGERYLVFARISDGRLSTNACAQPQYEESAYRAATASRGR